MIRLEFKINPRYLVYYTLVNCAADRFISGNCDPKIVAFQNLAWDKDKLAYDFLRFGLTERILFSNTKLATLGEKAELLISEMIADKSYNAIEQDTLHALAKTREEWESDLSRSYSMMTEMTGLLFEKEFEVFLTHPSQKNGHGGERICWSYRSDFPHYNTIYMWHEIMHSYLPAVSSDGKVEHAVIELLTDDEMRARFNNSIYPPFVGHEELKPLKEKLLASWRKYLKSPQKKINEYLKEASQILA